MGEVNGNMNQTVGFPDNRTPRNPIPSDAPTQSTVNPAPLVSNVSNPGVGVTPPNAGKPISVSGGAASTANPSVDLGRKVTGQVSGTSVVVNLPG
jgi:hypothetical protein